MKLLTVFEFANGDTFEQGPMQGGERGGGGRRSEAIRKTMPKLAANISQMSRY